MKWYRTRTRWIPRLVRRTIVLVIGSTIALIGVIMLVTPGPAIVVIPAGLGVLALEFAWARRWLRKVKKSASDATSILKREEKADSQRDPMSDAQ